MSKIKYSDVPSVPAGEFRLNGLQTNADRIRAMSDEELAEFMAERYSNEAFMRLIDEGCAITESARCTLKRGLYIVWFDWLKQEPDNPELGGDT